MHKRIKTEVISSDIEIKNGILEETNNYIEEITKKYNNYGIKIINEFPEPKKIFLKEIRPRGYQKKNISVRRGVVSSENIEVGSFICELPCEIYLKYNFSDLKTNDSSFFYHPNLNLVLKVLDKNFSIIRKSCRPNVELKTLIIKNLNQKKFLAERANRNIVRFALYAIKEILPSEEIFIEMDYKYGNTNNIQKCNCGNKNLCLNGN
ncbi:hypothetical protein CWI38_0956p0010 [Hamiltosporidium tvaerminnensis]|uniref:SET domain-containing protein n=2 Tax=Hamiltosporidium TaxID=1176354 RepID=A0A4Q9KU36_9MICR|nr:hypothetical protein LUQ84_001978 [Hamiltosporidium tvaerminnensis]TBT98337.1 hypothetical protein CWI39_2477p0010 [Hamiltosporidium magnivora]TBT99979.1 hypothetical protein CWI36_1785p0010 [Hamiltosporidium magnivora]TBU00480.1 hypothetical protein CWI37_0991p0010 [Hamiltosporidium tvaerminnensis]TBU11975.1 hypothetical protein CWI38_0956p0010 [Hamiltosporidium tvaerminnensis]